MRPRASFSPLPPRRRAAASLPAARPQPHHLAVELPVPPRVRPAGRCDRGRQRRGASSPRSSSPATSAVVAELVRDAIFDERSSRSSRARSRRARRCWPAVGSHLLHRQHAGRAHRREGRRRAPQPRHARARRQEPGHRAADAPSSTSPRAASRGASSPTRARPASRPTTCSCTARCTTGCFEKLRPRDTDSTATIRAQSPTTAASSRPRHWKRLVGLIDADKVVDRRRHRRVRSLHRPHDDDRRRAGRRQRWPRRSSDPILPVMRYETLDEAIAKIGERPQPAGAVPLHPRLARRASGARSRVVRRRLHQQHAGAHRGPRPAVRWHRARAGSGRTTAATRSRRSRTARAC